MMATAGNDDFHEDGQRRQQRRRRHRHHRRRPHHRHHRRWYALRSLPAFPPSHLPTLLPPPPSYPPTLLRFCVPAFLPPSRATTARPLARQPPIAHLLPCLNVNTDLKPHTHTHTHTHTTHTPWSRDKRIYRLNGIYSPADNLPQKEHALVRFMEIARISYR